MTELIPMELTEDEQRIILERRAEELHRQATKAFQLKAIRIASNYFDWCSDPENGFYVPNFGTFVNSFGYQEKDCNLMCAAVNQIWDLVFSFEIPKEKSQ